MELLLLHPEVAGRDCRHCWQWMYDEHGRVKMRHGKPQPRTVPPPCTMRIGCPKGHIDHQLDLSERNWRAYEHYLECKATGQFPQDAVVRRNAGIIRAVEDTIERHKRDNLLACMRGIMEGAIR